MAQYLLTVVEPSGGPVPDAGALDAIMKDVDAVDRAMRDAGVWVFAGGLYPPDSATVLRPSSGDVLVTDGPFAELKEQIGGYYVLQCKDLDEALTWAAQIPEAKHGTVEVRPIMEFPG